MPGPNFYVAMSLDRVAHLRGDRDWIDSRLAERQTLVIPVWRTKNLVVPGDEPRATLLAAAEAQTLLDGPSRPWLLGVIESRTYFALDLSHHEAPETLAPLSGRGDFVDLRSVGAFMPRDEAALLAYARGLNYWHNRHRYCGVCGAATEVREAGHLIVCTSLACGAEHFPRTDPAVIVLVSRGDRALLGRKHEWPEGMYSTIAGFVEPGESLEAAVAREVFEETGVRVADIRYHSSQPWPFPASLMLGYYASAVSETIECDRDELEDARWFTRAELAAGGAGIARRPRSDSIARRLIEEWIAEE